VREHRRGIAISSAAPAAAGPAATGRPSRILPKTITNATSTSTQPWPVKCRSRAHRARAGVASRAWQIGGVEEL